MSAPIRSKRSKKAKDEQPGLPAFTQSITPRTLEEDLPTIRQFATMYAQMNASTQEAVSHYIFPGKSLDYYYGAYVTASQMTTMAWCSNSEFAAFTLSILHGISHRIITIIEPPPSDLGR